MQRTIAERTATNDPAIGLVAMSTWAGSTSASTGPASARISATATAAATSPYVRRKRAIAACQFCRLRKTKCDNVRPVCGSCRHHQARCVYADGSEADGHQVGLDEAASRHREVLERLDDIRNLLVRASPPEASSSAALEVGSPLSVLSTIAGHNLRHDSASPHSVETDSVPGHQHSPSPTAYLQYTKCESVLKWPVLSNVIGDEDASIDSFIFDSHVRGDSEQHEVDPFSDRGQSSPSTRRSPGHKTKAESFVNHGLPEQDLAILCQKFLALVNCRNPIVDAHDLLSYAKSVAENGLGWDAKSCIVVCLVPSFIITRIFSTPFRNQCPVCRDIV